MSNNLPLYDELKNLGVRLEVNGTRLRLIGSVDVLTDELVLKAKTVKPDLIKRANREKLPFVWKVTIYGRRITVIDPNHFSYAEFRKSMKNKFNKVDRIERLSYSSIDKSC